MTKLDLESLTKIDFPRPLLEPEVRDLMKYIAQAEGSPSAISVSLHLEKNLYYETLPRPISSTISPAVNERFGDSNITGMIRKSTKSASFSLIPAYDGLSRPVFTGIQFNVTPGYEPGELEVCDSVELMNFTKRYAIEFFASEKVIA